MSLPVIRATAAPDIPAVRALLEETWHATYDSLLGRDKVTDISRRWHAEEVLAAEIGRSGQAFLVAEVDGQIAGTASAKITNASELELNRLYILPHFQGRGLGSALLAAVCAAFPAAQVIHLEVEPNNAPAIAFYAKAGFVAVSRGSACGGDTAAGVAHLVMRKAMP